MLYSMSLWCIWRVLFFVAWFITLLYCECSLPDFPSIVVLIALWVIISYRLLNLWLLGAFDIWHYIWVCFVDLRRAGDRALLLLLLLPLSISDDRIRGLWNWHSSLLLSNSILIVVADPGLVLYLSCQSFTTFASFVLRLNFFLFDVPIGSSCGIELWQLLYRVCLWKNSATGSRRLNISFVEDRGSF